MSTAMRDDKDANRAFAPHDHGACVAQSVAMAEEICLSSNVRLTDTRRKVLELLLEEHRPLGAYAILEKLRAQGQSAQPPVAYRALDFLIAQGLAHRIESLNAYVACINPTDCALPTFLICTRCERVAETEEKAADAAISRAADRLGFVIEQQLREASGTCPSCTAR